MREPEEVRMTCRHGREGVRKALEGTVEGLEGDWKVPLECVMRALHGPRRGLKRQRHRCHPERLKKRGRQRALKSRLD